MLQLFVVCASVVYMCVFACVCMYTYVYVCAQERELLVYVSESACENCTLVFEPLESVCVCAYVCVHVCVNVCVL